MPFYNVTVTYWKVFENVQAQSEEEAKMVVEVMDGKLIRCRDDEIEVELLPGVMY